MDTITTKTNGQNMREILRTGTHLPIVHDWRHEAMQDALRCREADGSPSFTILKWLQRHLPTHEAHFFWEHRNRTLAACVALLPDLAPVLTPSYRDYMGTTEPDIVAGWWRGTWPDDGSVFEVILAPDYHGTGDWVIAGANPESVPRFVGAVTEHATRHTCRALRFTGGAWKDAPEMLEEVSGTTWDDIVLPTATLTDIRTNIETFFTRKDVFEKLGFAWRRGILLVGPPGTGKTMVCKAAANAQCDIPFLYVRDLRGEARGDHLSLIFEHARRLAPCILAFEDLDGMVDKDNAENRAIFLNEMDGFRANDGLLIIASSNHPERIDEALLKRPSRFDRVYHIGLPAQAERAEYCRRLLARTPNLSPTLDTAALSAQVAKETEGFTPAFLKEAFLSAMLNLAHEGKTDLDDSFRDAVLEQVDSMRKYLRRAHNPESLAELIGSGPSGAIGFRKG